MKHFELGQMHKVDINEGFKEIKTAPERSSRSMSQEMEEQKRREAEKKRRDHEKLKNMVSFLTMRILLKKAKMIMILVMTTKLEVRWMT